VKDLVDRDSTDAARRAGSSPLTIRELINALGDRNGIKRQEAREMLVAMKSAATPALIEALRQEDWRVRWEAVKALGNIADPAAAPALVRALEDKRSDVRWLAAEGLIALQDKGLVPLLQALVHDSDSLWLREGAHHIFHDLMDKGLDGLAPIMTTLEGIEPAVQVPLAAQSLLDALTGSARLQENP